MEGNTDEIGLEVPGVTYLGGHPDRVAALRRGTLEIFSDGIYLYSARGPDGTDSVLDLQASDIVRLAISGSPNCAYLSVRTERGDANFEIRSLDDRQLRDALAPFEPLKTRIDATMGTPQSESEAEEVALYPSRDDAAAEVAS